jgi:hypothetical protein
VFDHEHGIAQIDELVKHVQQLADVVEVQARRRFVEQVEGSPGVRSGQFGRELNSLGFAARECRG